MIEVRRLSQEELVSGIRIDLFFAPILIALTRRCGFKTFKALKKIRAFKPLWAVQKFYGLEFKVQWFKSVPAHASIGRRQNKRFLTPFSALG
jgi:hypothetical protein